MNDEMKIGTRSKPYTMLDGDKAIIVADEIHYDVNGDTYLKIQVMVNADPTPEEVFKVELANPNSKLAGAL